ncbi:MAG: ClbS/DfsB family four-helix bundle protein [Tannerellaceae bacterium]|jgi:hypothetical protein|nr:ClbS/DfsB family four-helix bundle protein [Tannerellaceae bacterium]
MARPTTKSDLIIAANGQFDKLWKLIDSMSDEEQNAPFGSDIATKGIVSHWGRDRNLRDVLVHLYEWHQLLIKWIIDNREGEPKPFLPAPYNWRTYPKMNVGFWQKHQTTSLTDARKMLQESHEEVMSLIEPFSNDELFSANALAWTCGGILGRYCASATSSHYDWAMKKIKVYMNMYGIKYG